MSLFVSITWAHIKSRTKKFVTIWKQYVKLSTNDVRITVEKIQNLYSFLSITPHHRILNTQNMRREVSKQSFQISLSLYIPLYISWSVFIILCISSKSTVKCTFSMNPTYFLVCILILLQFTIPPYPNRTTTTTTTTQSNVETPKKTKTHNAKWKNPKTDCKLIPTESRTQSTAYLQEMAQLAKRAQTIIVHSHGQHGKDHHGNQYSPSVAQLQQRHDLANESYREVRSPSDAQQQQDGKCVIPVFQL